jgi:pimeloyl-ACP methyl ester carboxylesterase
MREVATDVTEVIIPSAGHWLIVKKPDAVVEIACEFIL